MSAHYTFETMAQKKKTPSKPKTAAKAARPRPTKPVFESRISFTTIGVRDFKRSLDFYRDTIGFKLHSLQGDIAMFDVGGSVLALYPYHLLAEDAGLKAGGSGFSGIAMAYNVRNAKDVDRFLGLLESRGTRILQKAEDKFWGGRSGYFADPDGYPWEIAWNPFIKMDAKGRLILKKK